LLALADMRALILEPRPDAVTEHGLIDVLTRQVTALSLRNAIDITVTGPPSRLPLTPKAEEQAHRIALERCTTPSSTPKRAPFASRSPASTTTGKVSTRPAAAPGTWA
jgi:hypothetical protein